MGKFIWFLSPIIIDEIILDMDVKIIESIYLNGENMKKMILVGKIWLGATFAKKIGQNLSLVVINKDIVKEILGDTIGF